METLMSVSNDVKFALERYSDIVKLRAAQVLALFIIYSLSLRDSEMFLDGASLLAISIPIFAWVFDLIARRQYMCPYAYALAAFAYQEGKSAEIVNGANNISSLVLDFGMGERSEVFKMFSEIDDELIRQRRFREWFTWKDQTVGGAIFGAFLVVALVATGAFEKPSEGTVEIPPAVTPATPGG